MTVNVQIPGPLRRLTAGESVVVVEGNDVREVLDSLEALHPGFRERIFDGDGALRQFINLFHNDEDVRFGQGLETPVAPGDTVSIVPAVAGGA